MSQIHQEVTFTAPPAKVYRALMDSAEHARFTGAPAEISADAGGTFSAYGGKVLGRNVELVANTRIVQAWRPADWPEGVYSIARFELRSEGGKTRLVFEQDGIPQEAVQHLDGGWQRMYWEPLRKYLES
jgi:activator of HSP90 ATPase